MKDFPARWEKSLPTGFEDAVETMGDEEIEETIIRSTKNKNITEQEKEDDDAINGAKAIIKDKNFKYNTYINMQKAKIEYIMYVMEQRGKMSDEVDDTLPKKKVTPVSLVVPDGVTPVSIVSDGTDGVVQGVIRVADDN